MFSRRSFRTLARVLACHLSSCGLVNYDIRPTVALGCLAALAASGTLLAIVLWPKAEVNDLEHRHDSLPAGHPHIHDSPSHSHTYVIDDYHPHWPRHN